MTTIVAVGMFAAVMLVAWFAASLLLKLSFVARLVDPESDRYANLDGIRGFLALTVFLHHYFVHLQFVEKGVWIAPNNAFLANCGSIPVQLFFAITGFLFWGRAIRGDGKIDVRSFAISRFFRIAPLYLAVTLFAFVLALQSTHFRFEGGDGETYLAITRLLSFGAFRIEYFNGVDLLPVTAGVAWTLVYEWAFYAALPALAWCAKLTRFAILAALFLLALAVFPIDELQYCALFLVGMAAAHLRALFPKTDASGLSWISISSLLLCLGVMLSSQLKPSSQGLIYLLPLFIALAFGEHWFGLLKTKPARLLGSASYSIYLLHGPILYVVIHLILGKEALLRMQPWMQAGMLLLVATLISVVAILSYGIIERPMIQLGKKLSLRSKTTPI